MNVSNWSILAVEDEPDGQEVVAGLLGHFGVRVEVTSNAEAAWQQLNTRPYDAVILDLALPGMNGLSLLKMIRDNPATANLPCVVTTAYHSSLVKKQAIEAGCNGFIPKPLRDNRLFDELKRILSGD